MISLRSFLKHEVPAYIACQIRSYLRIQWPDLNPEQTAIRETPAGVPLDRMTFVLVDGELLISHAEVNFRVVEVAGVRHRLGGLSGVFTYPAHRRSGAGQRVVFAASEYLRSSGVEFALLFCGEPVKSIYLQTGWEHLPDLRVTYGDPLSPTKYEEASPAGLVLTLFSSEPRAGLREELCARSTYVGTTTW